MRQLLTVEIDEVCGGAEEKPDFSNVESGFSTTGEVREEPADWMRRLWLF